ncbi:MAG: SPOR domain-containing protein [Vulcanimicrobiota bacterium]
MRKSAYKDTFFGKFAAFLVMAIWLGLVGFAWASHLVLDGKLLAHKEPPAAAPAKKMAAVDVLTVEKSALLAAQFIEKPVASQAKAPAETAEKPAPKKPIANLGPTLAMLAEAKVKVPVVESVAKAPEPKEPEVKKPDETKPEVKKPEETKPVESEAKPEEVAEKTEPEEKPEASPTPSPTPAVAEKPAEKPVEKEVAEQPARPLPEPSTAPSGAQQYGAFAKPDNAERLAEELKQQGKEAHIEQIETDQGVLYRVRSNGPTEAAPAPAEAAPAPEPEPAPATEPVEAEPEPQD